MIKKLLLSGIALTAAMGAQAASVSGDIKFSVEVPEILVLYHWDTARLTLTAANGIHKNNGAGTGTGDINVGSYTVNGSLNTDSPFGSTNKISVKLRNSWAVRAIATNDPTLTLAPSSGSAYTLNNGTSSLTISDAVLNCTTGSGCPTPATGSTLIIGKGWAVNQGDIDFKIDLSTLQKSGTYQSSGTGETFKLTFATTP